MIHMKIIHIVLALMASLLVVIYIKSKSEDTEDSKFDMIEGISIILGTPYIISTLLHLIG